MIILFLVPMFIGYLVLPAVSAVWGTKSWIQLARGRFRDPILLIAIAVFALGLVGHLEDGRLANKLDREASFPWGLVFVFGWDVYAVLLLLAGLRYFRSSNAMIAAAFMGWSWVPLGLFLITQLGINRAF